MHGRIPNIPYEDRFALQVNEAAELSGLSRRTIYNLINDGRLRSEKVRGRRTIVTKSLQALLGGKSFVP